MKNIFIYISFIIIFCSISTVKAQDIHFSQFFASPLNVNPANTGNFDGDYRFILNNKNQWQSFADAYRTFAGSFDMGINDLWIKNSLAGVGLQINNDIAGDGKFGTTQLYLNGSYYLPVLKEHGLFAGLGFNVGYVFHGIDFENLRFGDQFQNEYYNSEYFTEEVWDNKRINYFDLGLGLNIIYKNNPGFIPQIGLSVLHINMPGRSFYDNSDRYLPIKWTISGGADIALNDNFWIEPLLLIMLQQKYREYNLGAMCRYDYGLAGLQSLYFGALFRTRDAAILCLGVKYNNIKLSMNYDINVSKLTRISRGKGGIEFSLIYVIYKAKIFETPHYRKCPDFI
ncbi:MAG: PorP/SprF family type IX secretion system membrane protein [Bacteroidales bacterium]|jgi:type IX secretion system PorP/SprF family membrane protein|nr:PorP/SprF family type IX secretion system membrane protein [Bacteroidales bacterium]